MKSIPSISTQLGITQQDLAMLLGVTRSQISMYELRQRNLPTRAMILLSEMTLYVNAAAATAKDSVSAAEVHVEKQELELLLRENEFQLLQINRKITVLNEKQETRSKVVRLGAFLNECEAGKGIAGEVFQIKARKASETLEGKWMIELIKLRIRQELLVHENKLLTSNLRKLEK